MKREYIILREEPDFGFAFETRTRGATRGAEPPPPTALRVELDELTDREHELINRDPMVSTAPDMVTHLVEPLPAENHVATAMTEAWGISAVGADRASEIGYTGAGASAAVLDTGIDRLHPAFSGVALIEKDFTGSGNGDRNGHGTHAAGTIFGRDVDGVRIGVAPGLTEVYVGKVLGDDGRGSTKMIIQGLRWAMDLGVDVISLSLGIDFTRQVKRAIEVYNYEEDQAASRTLLDFAQNLRMFDRVMEQARSKRPFEEGSVIVAATGNDSRPTYRIATSLPAYSTGVLSVGATEYADVMGASERQLHKVAQFSNSPPTIVAPGVNILSARVGGGLTAKSGTSMACPHVAGVAALWWEYVRRRPIPVTPAQVDAQLFANCRFDVFSKTTDESDRGTGLVTAPLN